MIPDGIYQEPSGIMRMMVDNANGVISSWMMGKMAAIYKYSIENGVIKMSSIKDGVELFDYITIYSNPSRFHLKCDNVTFTYASPIE